MAYSLLAMSALNTAQASYDFFPKRPLITSLTHEEFTGIFRMTDYLDNPDDYEETAGFPENWRINWEGCRSQRMTKPGLRSREDLADPIAMAAQKYLPLKDVRERKVISAAEVTQDADGLRFLIARGCYRSAANLVARLLTALGQGYGKAGRKSTHTPHSLQLWFTRLALLTKVGEFELLRAEAEPFGQLTNADIFYQRYPEQYGDRWGSMACFSFRLLLAELPIYFGDLQSVMTNMFNLSSSMLTMMNIDRRNFVGGALLIWERRLLRVGHSLINCALLMRNYCVAHKAMVDLLRSYNMMQEDRRVLFSAWGRIFVRMRLLEDADKHFAIARDFKAIRNSPPDFRELVDSGLMALAKKDTVRAMSIFNWALLFDMGNVMIWNNMGLCMLVEHKLGDAIKMFERAIEVNPGKALKFENLLVNLATSYDREPNSCRSKKLHLLSWINKYIPDLSICLDLCLKLHPN